MAGTDRRQGIRRRRSPRWPGPRASSHGRGRAVPRRPQRSRAPTSCSDADRPQVPVAAASRSSRTSSAGKVPSPPRWPSCRWSSPPAAPATSPPSSTSSSRSAPRGWPRGRRGPLRGRAHRRPEDQRLAAALSRPPAARSTSGSSSTPPCSAGIVTQIGDTVIDGSVRHRLDQLAKRSEPQQETCEIPWLNSPSTPATSPPPPQEPRGLHARRSSHPGRPGLEVGDGIARVSGLPDARSTSCSSSRTAPSAWP
jgi:hypothetical protein